MSEACLREALLKCQRWPSFQMMRMRTRMVYVHYNSSAAGWGVCDDNGAGPTMQVMMRICFC